MSDEFNEPESEGVKSLRKALEKREAEMAEKDKQLAELLKRDRSRTIAEKLAALGAKPGLAEFVPESVEVDSLGQWLTEKADLFGFKIDQPADNPQNVADAAAQSRISGFELKPSDAPDSPEMKLIAGAKNARELTDAIYAAQMGR